MMLGESASLLDDIGGAARAGEHETYNRATTIAAMALMTNLGALTMLPTPVVIADYASGGRLNAAQASMLTSAELGGMTAAVLLMPLVLARIDSLISGEGVGFNTLLNAPAEHPPMIRRDGESHRHAGSPPAASRLSDPWRHA